MQTFLFECQEDYDLMMREMNDTTNGQGQSYARINGTQITPGRTLADFPNWMSTQQVRFLFWEARYGTDTASPQLNNLGFDSFPIDYLEGPDAILAWLADEHNLNKTVSFCSLLSFSRSCIADYASPTSTANSNEGQAAQHRRDRQNYSTEGLLHSRWLAHD